MTDSMNKKLSQASHNRDDADLLIMDEEWKPFSLVGFNQILTGFIGEHY